MLLSILIYLYICRIYLHFRFNGTGRITFMRGRNILEDVVILYKTVHELHRKKKDGVTFKIDFKKAYDKMKWCSRPLGSMELEG